MYAKSLDNLYKKDRFLGQGNSKVYKGRRLSDNLPVVLKMSSSDNLPVVLKMSDSQRMLLREHSILSMLNPNCDIKSISCIIDMGYLQGIFTIVMEYIDNAFTLTLYSLPEDIIKLLSICYDIAVAIKYLHDKGVAHRDIKPDNILIKSDNAILIDFDKSCLTTDTASDLQSSLNCKTFVGTPYFMAPELLNADLRDEILIDPTLWLMCDIYSLGSVFYYIFSRKRNPYNAYDIDRLYQLKLNKEPTPIHSGNGDVDDLVTSMMNKNIFHRPSIDVVIGRLSTLIKII